MDLQTQPNQTEEAQLLAQIQAELAKQPADNNPQQAVQQPQAPSIPVNDGQAPIQAEPTVQPDTTVNTETSVVEPKQGVSFEELQQKQGFKSVDDLAGSYTNLVKKLHEVAAENSKLRQQPQQPYQPQPQISPQQPVYQEPADPNKKFLEDLVNDPIRTMAEVLKVVNKPLYENQREIEFRNELTRLSSSPKTADFNLPEVQQEIQKIIQERPQRYIDNFGKVAPEVMEDLYWMAKGRVSNSKVIGTNAPINRAVPVEGANKPIGQQVPSDPKNMSEADLKIAIQNLLAQQR